MSKRKYLIILFILEIIILVPGCSNKQETTLNKGNQSPLKVKHESPYNMINSEVTLKIQEGSVSKNHLTIILTNNSTQNISYGTSYWLEIKKEEKWYILETIKELVFTSPSLGLKPKESKEMKIYWEHAYGELEPGIYRVIKGFSYESGDIFEEDSYIAAEFIVE